MDGHRRADNTSTVAQGGGDDRRLDGQARNPLVVQTRDAATDHEDSRVKQPLVLVEDHGHPLGPLFVAQFLAVLGMGRRLVLRLSAVNDEVPDLGVGEQMAISNKCRANARAEGKEYHRPLAGLRGSELDLGEASGVGVIEHADLTLGKIPAEKLLDIGVDPRRVDVGRGGGHLALDYGWNGDAHRAVPFGLPNDLRDRLCDRVRRRRLRGGDLNSLADELTVVEIDAGTLDAGAADVDAKTDVAHGAQHTNYGHNEKVTLTPLELTHLRTTAVEVATLAAERIRTKRAELATASDIRDFSTTKSTDVDPVTIVDTLAEDLIADELQRRRPADGMIGEEGHARASISGVSWIVDPIDGTVNFLYGIGEYAVSIGAAIDGRVVAGAVINVATGAVYSAAEGQGATLVRHGATVVLRANHLTETSQALLATGFAYASERRRAQAELLTQILPQVRDIRRMGAAALDLCRVAEGTVDAYYEHGINSWDYAAGIIIAAEAGAIVRAPDLSTPGQAGEITYVSAPLLAPSLTHMLEEAGAFTPLDLQG